MPPTDSLISHWYFHVPNLVLAALIWALAARGLLALVFHKTPTVLVLKVLAAVTDPVLRVVRAVTPRIVPQAVVMVFAMVWLLALRMLWFLTVVAAGARPKI